MSSVFNFKLITNEFTSRLMKRWHERSACLVECICLQCETVAAVVVFA